MTCRHALGGEPVDECQTQEFLEPVAHEGLVRAASLGPICRRHGGDRLGWIACPGGGSPPSAHKP